MAAQRIPLETRIAKFSRPGPSGCVDWAGARSPKSYGLITVDRRCERAHRVVWQLHNGKIPDGACVMHACDRPSCVNIAHLGLGSNADNMADRDRKERQSKGAQHWTRTQPSRLSRGAEHYAHTRPHLLPRGESHGRARLCTKDVLKILIRSTIDGESPASIARDFGTDGTHVARIAARLSWRHIPWPSGKLIALRKEADQPIDAEVVPEPEAPKATKAEEPE